MSESSEGLLLPLTGEATSPLGYLTGEPRGSSNRKLRHAVGSMVMKSHRDLVVVNV